jgi:hypothetical protein
MAERRLSSLQARSAYPTDGKTLLIELAGGDTAGLAEIIHQGIAANVVGIGLSSQNADSLRELAARFPRHVWLIDDMTAPEDVAATIIGADTVIARSASLSASAFAYGRAWLPVAGPGGGAPEGLPESTGPEFRPAIPAGQLAAVLQGSPPVEPDRALLGPLQGQLDAHFDRVAQVAEQVAWARRRAPSDLGGGGARSGQPIDMDSYSNGLAAPGYRRRIEDERDALARREQEMGDLLSRFSWAEAELAALNASRTFRYTKRVRRGWLRLLQVAGRR